MLETNYTSRERMAICSPLIYISIAWLTVKPVENTQNPTILFLHSYVFLV